LQQPVRADQADALRLGLLDQPRRELLVDYIRTASAAVLVEVLVCEAD
jgi:hypothetical protein